MEECSIFVEIHLGECHIVPSLASQSQGLSFKYRVWQGLEVQPATCPITGNEEQQGDPGQHGACSGTEQSTQLSLQAEVRLWTQAQGR